jgi:hypothetical protein
MDFSTRTSSVRVCHFATSAGRLRISPQLDLSLKFSVENGVVVAQTYPHGLSRAEFDSPRCGTRLFWRLLNDR